MPKGNIYSEKWTGASTPPPYAEFDLHPYFTKACPPANEAVRQVQGRGVVTAWEGAASFSPLVLVVVVPRLSWTRMERWRDSGQGSYLGWLGSGAWAAGILGFVKPNSGSCRRTRGNV